MYQQYQDEEEMANETYEEEEQIVFEYKKEGKNPYKLDHKMTEFYYQKFNFLCFINRISTEFLISNL
jgi:hypothetical protein